MAASVERCARGPNPGAVLELGELPHRARPRVANAGGAGIGSTLVEVDRVEGPFQGEAESTSVRHGRAPDDPDPCPRGSVRGSRLSA